MRRAGRTACGCGFGLGVVGGKLKGRGLGLFLRLVLGDVAGVEVRGDVQAVGIAIEPDLPARLAPFARGYGFKGFDVCAWAVKHFVMDVQVQAVRAHRAFHRPELAGASNGFVRLAHTATEQGYRLVEEVGIVGFPVAVAAMRCRQGHQGAGIALALCCWHEDLRDVVAHLRGAGAGAMGAKLVIAAVEMVMHFRLEATRFERNCDLRLVWCFAGELLPPLAADGATSFDVYPRGLECVANSRDMVDMRIVFRLNVLVFWGLLSSGAICIFQFNVALSDRRGPFCT